MVLLYYNIKLNTIGILCKVPSLFAFFKGINNGYQNKYQETNR